MERQVFILVLASIRIMSRKSIVKHDFQITVSIALTACREKDREVGRVSSL